MVRFAPLSPQCQQCQTTRSAWRVIERVAWCWWAKLLWPAHTHLTRRLAPTERSYALARMVSASMWKAPAGGGGAKRFAHIRGVCPATKSRALHTPDPLPLVPQKKPRTFRSGASPHAACLIAVIVIPPFLGSGRYVTPS